MRKALTLLLALVCAASRADRAPERLLVSENRRFLVDEAGRPFFYLADTAWELFHRLTREEADEYLRARAAQGFTAIQAVALAECDGLTVPNAYGFLPFTDGDPARPALGPGGNDDYWDNVDWMVRRANGLGLYVAMLPTWGRYWHDGEKPLFDSRNARAYGEWLGRRYAAAKVIWILGGDRNPEGESHRAALKAMAEGLRRGDGGAHLITYHPGGSWGSADFFHGASWLDFNMRENGHNTWYEVYHKTLTDYERSPARPVVDGEPVYEDHPVAFDARRRGHSVAADCRRALYWDLFNGACGHTYGHHSVWQMYDPAKRAPVNNPLMSWREALRQPGAGQMRHAKRLLMSRPYLTRVPATARVLPSGDPPTAWPGEGLYRFVATMDTDATYLMVYAPAGRAFRVNTAALAPGRLTGWWFNPRDGKSRRIRTVERGEAVPFLSPNPGEELDWVLIVELADRKYGRV